MSSEERLISFFLLFRFHLHNHPNEIAARKVSPNSHYFQPFRRPAPEFAFSLHIGSTGNPAKGCKRVVQAL
jgi:hypothetical protein